MKNGKHYLTAGAGILLAVLGIVLLKVLEHPGQIFLVPAYVCVGLGCGLFGHGVGELIAAKAVQGDPDIQKQLEIEKNDERNKAIFGAAKAKAFDMMTFVFGILMLVFALMDIGLAPILLLVLAYLLVQGCAVYFLVKYQKER